MSDKESRRQKLERILEISRELSSTISLEPLLHKIVDTATELTDCESSSILLLDNRSGELRFLTASGLAGQLRNIPVPVEGSIAGAVLRSGEPAVISDTRSDPRHYRAVGQLIDLETRSLLAVPLSIKERHIGVLEAINKQREKAFEREDVETLTALAAQAAVAIENARMVAALREAYEQLGELDRMKSNFIAIASHELRMPLSLILLYAAMLREQMDTAGAAQEVDAVLRAAMRLKHIIETMLNLRYLETGEMALAPTHFDLRDAVQDACEDYVAIAQAGGKALVKDLPEEHVPVFADKEKVRVVLDNLISNAVKFTPSGGRVQVALEPRGDEVEIAVMDTGVGIPREEISRIFDRFYQVEDHMTRRHGGMGLGLSIVKGLVELHGGHVAVESVPGQGSRFVVRMPAEVRTYPVLTEAVG